MSKRRHQRFTKRLETVFFSGDLDFRGISSDLSEGGLFIRTQHGLVPGTIIDIRIYLPDNKISALKGIVRRTTKKALSSFAKNGMGVELLEKDSNYVEFLKAVGILPPDHADATRTTSPGEDRHGAPDGTQQVPEFFIVPCRSCSVKNRIAGEKIMLAPRCGKCGELLETEGIS